MTRHTFLLEAGMWEAAGTFYDEDGEATHVSGSTRITHVRPFWLCEGEMQVQSEPPRELRNEYRIVPFAGDADTTSWRSHNPALGDLSGTFTIVGEMIVSLYTSAGGIYRGTEHLQRIDANHYRATGCLCKGVQKISSWSVELTRMASGEDRQ